MSSEKTMAPAVKRSVPPVEDLLDRYGCGPINLAGDSDALYERHLTFDNVIDAQAADPRENYEAIARSVRDILSQRWLRTEGTYAGENPKRVYYLSMEFLIGRSLTNNITNLLLDPVAKQVIADKNLDGQPSSRKSLTQVWETAGLTPAACFLESMATLQLPPWVTGCAIYGISSKRSERVAGRTTGQLAAAPIRGRSPGHTNVEIAWLLLRGARRRVGGDFRRPSSLSACPSIVLSWVMGQHDQYARLCRRGAHQFDFKVASAGEFVSASPNASRRVTDPALIPTTPRSWGKAFASCRVSGRLLGRGHRAPLPQEQRRVVLIPRQGRHAAQRHAPEHGGCRTDAGSPRRSWLGMG
jgi:starch phosphorylase